MATARPRKKRSKEAPEPRGLTAAAVGSGKPPAALEALAAQVEDDGGAVIGSYREPLGSHWQLLAALPLDRVEPTPYQRDLSPTHVARLADAIDRLGRFVDPVVAVRTDDGRYWTPNGNHRLAAMRQLGARAVLAIVVPDQSVAHRILVLNTEKAHNVRERALEVIRLAEALSALDDRPEREYETEFEEPALLTLGACYEVNGRFSGGAYHPILKRTEAFSAARLSKALATRRERAQRLLALDAAVVEKVAELKARGLESPYLKAFVVARINPIRFKRGAKMDPDEIIEKMTAAAGRFDTGKIKPGQIAAAGGPPDE
ncbi:MAG: ParB/RepB/Spo0J family partition protein [Gemmatimonadales bacterium]